MRTRVVSIRLDGQEYTPLAASDAEGDANTPALDTGFPDGDAVVGQGPGDSKYPPCATHTVIAAKALRKDATTSYRKLSLLQWLRAMHRYPVDRRRTHTTVRDSCGVLVKL